MIGAEVDGLVVVPDRPVVLAFSLLGNAPGIEDHGKNAVFEPSRLIKPSTATNLDVGIWISESPPGILLHIRPGRRGQNQPKNRN